MPVEDSHPPTPNKRCKKCCNSIVEESVGILLKKADNFKKVFSCFIISLSLQDYTTPLILAAAGGHTACVIELLEQGADPNARRVVSIAVHSLGNHIVIGAVCWCLNIPGIFCEIV